MKTKIQIGLKKRVKSGQKISRSVDPRFLTPRVKVVNPCRMGIIANKNRGFSEKRVRVKKGLIWVN